MQIARNSVYTMLGMALPFVVGIVTVPLYIAEIGADRYGALSIAWVLLGYFGQMDFGIGRALTQRISATGGVRSPTTAHIVWSSIISSAGFGVTGGLVVLVGASYFFGGELKIGDSLRGELLESVWALAICNPVVALAGVTSGALVGLERFRTVSIGTLVSNTGLQVFPLITAHFLSNDLGALIISALFARIIGLGIFSFAVWRNLLRGQPFSASGREIKSLANFGVWIMISSFVGPLMMVTDRFIIGSYLGAAAVAAYTIPFQVAYRLQILPLAIAQVLFPRFAAEHASQSAQRCGDYTVLIAQIFAPVMIGMICVAAPLLHLWLGHHLDPRSVAIAQILCAGIWVNAIAQIPFNYIQARGNSRFTAVLHVAELPVYVGMLIGFGLVFGLNGAAAAFSLRCAIDCVALVLKAKMIGKWTLLPLCSQTLLLLAALMSGFMLHGWIEALAAGAALALASIIFTLLQVPDGIRARLLTLPAARFFWGLGR